MSIFHPNWHLHHRPTVGSSHKGIIKIYRPSGEQPTWTPEEGLVGGEDIVVYEGKARWQKRGQTTSQDFGADTARFQRVQIQISLKRFMEFADPGMKIQTNDRVVLVENESNPLSENSLVYVWGMPTSSNAWLITLICQDNYKQVANE